tara:strand:+ start:1279 stop:1524 length:246 start_codon:yes stop_codon:yes gene_type:complete
MLIYSETLPKSNRKVQVIAFATSPMTSERFSVSVYEHDGEYVDDVVVRDLRLALKAVRTLDHFLNFNKFRVRYRNNKLVEK